MLRRSEDRQEPRGRAIKSGEFAFKLIQVANYNDTEGELISATTNDEFGMVDFDKANNVSGDLENPSCLPTPSPAPTTTASSRTPARAA